MTEEQRRRKAAAERSRRFHYREQKPGVFAIGDDGCDHLLDAEGACVYCDRQIVIISGSVRQRG